MNNTLASKTRDLLIKYGFLKQDSRSVSTVYQLILLIIRETIKWFIIMINDINKPKEQFAKKVYVHRNSLLVDLMEVSHLCTIYNIFISSCILVFICTFLYYEVEPEKMKQDWDIIKWCLSKFPYVAIFWLLFNLFAFVCYEGFKLWILVRNKIQSKIADQIFLILYVTSYTLTFIISGYYLFKLECRPILGFAISSEQGRIYMKIHSFVRECVPRALQHKPKKDGSQNLCPTRRHYLYYLFAPTLLYRDHYPRTEKIKWENVFYHTFNFFVNISLLYCILMRFHELFVNVGVRPFTLKQKVETVGVSTFVGIVAIFSMFYVILHCWLNISAELLKFGDREFYSDWWNATTLGQHYRKWNIVVHDWLYVYIYVDFQKLGFTTAMCRTLTFIISCMFHEYMISLSLGFYYPTFGLIYALGGLLIVPLTRGKKAQRWNFLFWLFTLAFATILAYHYALEWHARINCPKQETTFDFFIPRILDPSCQITTH